MKCEGENLVFYESPSAKRFCLANESTLLLGQNLQPFFFFLFQRSLHGTSRGLSIFCVCFCSTFPLSGARVSKQQTPADWPQKRNK